MLPPQENRGKDHPDDKEDEERKGGFKNCCKKSLKFLFSHIGLCGMVIAYSVAGGFIFEHLEKTNEKQECIKAQEKYEPAENETAYKLWEISTNFRYDDDQEFAVAEFEKVLKTFRDSVLDLGYDGKNCTNMGSSDGPGYRWSFPGALLFSVTVITTIGYGNIAPKTFWGRLVCIAYATLGIPLMLLCLANLGDVLADIFRFVYTKVCCCGCCRRKDKNKVESLQDQQQDEPGKRRPRTPEAWKTAYNQQKGVPGAQPPPPAQKGPVVLDDEEDDDDEEEEKISVPLTITMAIIGGYIFMGALLFGVWEGWDPLKASYFCFVTISTIGFGDVVPGSAEFENAEDQWKMVGAAVYMLFGMAILSMCFSLIQEEIVAKFKWVGEKLGIVEKDKDVDLDEEDMDGDGRAEQTTQPMNPHGPPHGRGPHPMTMGGPHGAPQQRGPHPPPIPGPPQQPMAMPPPSQGTAGPHKRALGGGQPRGPPPPLPSQPQQPLPIKKD